MQTTNSLYPSTSTSVCVCSTTGKSRKYYYDRHYCHFNRSLNGQTLCPSGSRPGEGRGSRCRCWPIKYSALSVCLLCPWYVDDGRLVKVNIILIITITVTLKEITVLIKTIIISILKTHESPPPFSPVVSFFFVYSSSPIAPVSPNVFFSVSTTSFRLTALLLLLVFVLIHEGEVLGVAAFVRPSTVNRFFVTIISPRKLL